jgi:hypothetical protein
MEEMARAAKAEIRQGLLKRPTETTLRGIHLSGEPHTIEAVWRHFLSSEGDDNT